MYGKDQKQSNRKILVVLICARASQVTHAIAPQNLRPWAVDCMRPD